jgi:hypothetical protein
MRTRLPSPALIVAALALLLSLTGTAVAAGLITGSQIANNTISHLDVKNNDLRSADVRDNTLTSADVLNGTLKAIDFAPNQLKPGPAGPAGPAGAQGPAGPQGAPGLAGLEIVKVQGPLSSDSSRLTTVTCPAGKKVVGGGGQVVGGAGDVALDESYPLNATAWRAVANETNATAAAWFLSAYAVCATAA